MDSIARRQPRLALAGIGLIGRASFEIPGDTDPLIFKHTLWRAPDLKAVTSESTPGELYDAMGQETFRRFAKKYLSTLFVER